MASRQARTFSTSADSADSSSLSSMACWLVLATAFLGWFCAGWQLAIASIAMPDAVSDLLGEGNEPIVGLWYGRVTGAFLLGAASGGYLLGWVGDRYGRARAMALSILCYSVFSAAAVFAVEPYQLVVLRFLGCLGVGGMWPNGIALVSEAWPNISRPMLAGAIGTSANLGIMMFSAVASLKNVTVDDWHWIMWLGATPIALGLLVWVAVPESPRWMAVRQGQSSLAAPRPAGLAEIFRRPILGTTVLAITLGTIPIFGGWGSSNWVMPWAAEVGDRINDPSLKAQLSLARSLPGAISSLLGGWVASAMGRRRSYFIFSLGALVSAQILFGWLTPDGDRFWFIFWFAALGFFSGFYFGWLPLCLPELFPTRVRATGAGVGFNWGRILTAVGVLAAGELLKGVFHGDYAQVGRATSLVYAAGLIVVFFMPDTSQRSIRDD